MKFYESRVVKPVIQLTPTIHAKDDLHEISFHFHPHPIVNVIKRLVV